MAVREFNGTSDRIITSIGSCNITGAYTIAVVERRLVNTSWHALVSIQDSGGTGQVTCEISQATTFNSEFYVDQGTVGSTNLVGQPFVAADGWSLLVVTKAAGSTAPRLHYSRNGAAMAHANLPNAFGNPNTQAGGSVHFGDFGGSDWAQIRLAAAAVWSGVALADGDCANLLGSNTSGWLGNSGGAPSGMWEHGSATVLDLTGNGADASTTGGSVIAGDDPPSGVYTVSSGSTVDNTTKPARIGMFTPHLRSDGWF